MQILVDRGVLSFSVRRERGQKEKLEFQYKFSVGKRGKLLFVCENRKRLQQGISEPEF